MSQVSMKVGNVVLPVSPICSSCKVPMVLRTAQRGKSAGSQFYGCKKYPLCKNTMPYVPTQSTLSNSCEELPKSEVVENTLAGFAKVTAARKKKIKNNLF